MNINKDMIVLDIVEKYPETEDVFHKFDDLAGVCILCSNLFDSIDEVSSKYNINLDKFLQQLNKVIKK